ncbi:HAD hydrolase-like protein [Candidatus Curtissbacteria bacterium]|nr:HAD hydrolase-like protein [Candidatus Curtissbacteria bacterium]
MKKNKKLFSWDFHGTLEQGTEVGFAEILKQLAREFEVEREIDLTEVRQLFGTSMQNYLKHFFPEVNKSTHTKMLGRVPNIQTKDQITAYLSPAPYAIEVLEKIKGTGHTNIIVSNSSPKHIGKFIEIIEIGHLIDKIFAIDRHFSKVTIDPILAKAQAIRKYAADNGFDQVIVIGDRKTDIDAGRMVGAITVQYIKRDFPIDLTDADYKIKNLREVLRLI